MLSAIKRCFGCADAPVLHFGERTLRIERLLGEGGFAYVYLVVDVETGKQYAVKRIRCVFGGESVAAAMREVDACTRFLNSSRVLSCFDSQIRQEQDGTKTVDILLPFYPNGSLQDRITDNVIQGQCFPEETVIDLALGVACAIADMHHYKPSETAAPPAASPLADALPAELSINGFLPYAHRDIKPSNIMFSQTNPVLVDLGSSSPARIHVQDRHAALELQELAAEHCTLAYRAPELLDVRTGAQLSEKVDIWGFGCTVYATMYSVSPFEHEEEATGANINIAIARGAFSFPPQPSYSQKLKDLVQHCLTVDSNERPSIDDLINALQAMHTELVDPL